MHLFKIIILLFIFSIINTKTTSSSSSSSSSLPDNYRMTCTCDKGDSGGILLFIHNFNR